MDMGYLEWAVEKVVLWDRTLADAECGLYLVGIYVFPIKYKGKVW
jgi:hypothetical protein